MPAYGYPRQRTPHRFVKLLRNRTYTIIAISAALVLGYFVFSTKGFLSRVQISRDLAEKEERVLTLQRDLRMLGHERDRLRDDRKAVERVARETHGMIKPGEIVYRILPADQQHKKK
jgi:cell division protein FtsB